MSKNRKALLVFLCFFLICTSLFAQEREYRPREQFLWIDIPLTLAEVTLVNAVGNIYWRLWGPDSHVAYFTADSIRHNLHYSAWHWEEGLGGDTFLVNQLFHSYAGAFYFASARSNNFNFYWSMLFPFIGSVQWETFAETEMPATNDLITTFSGGIILGEILHRLYMELNKGGTGAKIGATFLSPTGRITDVIRRYGPEDSPSRINHASLAFGFSWLNARFYETGDETLYWNRPSIFADFDLVYDNPYTASSRTPFDQFDLSVSLALAIPQIYNLSVVADGYLASWLLTDNEKNQASNGLSLHFDFHVSDRGFMELNSGRENLNFSATSLDYTIKWRRFLNNSLELSLKTHLGFSPWAVAAYNGGENKDDYNLFMLGGNFKLFFELRQRMENMDRKNGHVFGFHFSLFDTWYIPKTPNFNVNAIFLASGITYSFPLGNRISLYAADRFLLLYCRPARDAGEVFPPDILRWLNNAQVGVKFTF